MSIISRYLQNPLQTAAKTMLVTVLALCISNTSFASEDEKYRQLETQTKNYGTGKVEIVKFFNYGCPHCYALDPLLHEWEQANSDNVVVIREAAPLHSSWKPYSEAFYASQVLGVTELFHVRLFDAIHQENRKIKSPKSILSFVEELGIDKDEFKRATKSDEVKASIEEAYDLAKKIDISGVPTMLVGGKFLTSAKYAGGIEELIEVLDYLIESEFSE